MRFRPEQHLRRPGDFRTVRELGRRLDCGAFTVWYFRRAPDATPAALPRVGVVASIASVGAAVQRSRAKRRLREVFRQHQGLVPAGSDLLLVARAAVNRLDYPALAQKFTDACRKLAPPPHA
jgi:ribonuclease P protein component